MNSTERLYKAGAETNSAIAVMGKRHRGIAQFEANQQKIECVFNQNRNLIAMVRAVEIRCSVQKHGTI